MELDGEIVALHDRVFDISANRGYGRVTKISENYFEVAFVKGSVRYDNTGTQINKTWKTLFWTRPMIVAPRKNESEWEVRETLKDEFFDLVRRYKDYV